MFAAVVDADTAVNIPGINPLADTKVSIEPSTVLATNVPTCPTYNPPATNPKEGLEKDALANAEPDVTVTPAPPLNCGLVLYCC